MAAIELDGSGAFNPEAFTAFLADQEDLGTKWAPRFVRVMKALPVTASDKVDKKPLRAQRWRPRTRSGTGWAGATATFRWSPPTAIGWSGSSRPTDGAV